jgi:hypothetical protein
MPVSMGVVVGWKSGEYKSGFFSGEVGRRDRGFDRKSSRDLIGI